MIDITSPIVCEATAHYGVTPTDLTPMIGGHVTTVYEFVKGGAHYVLRIVPPGVESSPAEMRSIQAWVSYLARHDGPVPTPLPAMNGEELIVIERPEGAYTVLTAGKARGIRAETLSQSDWTDGYFRNLGATAASLHRIAEGYVPAPDLRRADILATSGLFSADQPVDPMVTQRKREVLATLTSLPQTPDRYGMIHGDFHFGNFFVEPSHDYAVTVFDFDDCGYGGYMLDTATLLFDIAVLYDGTDRDAFAAHFLHQYLTGYRGVRAIEPGRLAELPHFLKLLEISYYAMLAPAYESGQESDWWVSRFMPGRRQRVENGVPYIALDPRTIVVDLP